MAFFGGLGDTIAAAVTVVFRAVALETDEAGLAAGLLFPDLEAALEPDLREGTALELLEGTVAALELLLLGGTALELLWWGAALELLDTGGTALELLGVRGDCLSAGPD